MFSIEVDILCRTKKKGKITKHGNELIEMAAGEVKEENHFHTKMFHRRRFFSIN